MLILVTGATGFVGSHVARLLAARGDRIRVLIRRTSQFKALEGVRVEPVEGDLRDAVSLARAMEGVQRVFHVAADYRLWTRHPEEIYESNVGGTQAASRSRWQAGVERFVYTSTVATIAVPRHGALPERKYSAPRSTK